MVSFLHFLREQRMNLPIIPTEASCKGRTYVVTGANTGLGFECAQHLVKLQAHTVILACRSLSRGVAAKKRIEKETGRVGVVDVWQLDVGSWDSVEKFASRFDTLERVDAVIENASVAMLEYHEIEDLESTLAINVVGTFLLAALLLPKLEHCAKRYGMQPHLVIVGSAVAFRPEGHLEKVEGDMLEGLTEQAKTSMANRYPVSKLLQLYTMREFSQHLTKAGSGVVINFVNPGLCKTELSRNAGPVLQFIFSIFKAFVARTAEMGSRNYLYAILAGPESHGGYLSACRMQNDIVPSWVTNSLGAATQKRVWDSVTKKLGSISPGALQASLSG